MILPASAGPLPIGVICVICGQQLRLHPAASRVAKLAQQTPSSFVAFDAIAVDGHDLRDTPQRDRRAALERLLAGVKPPERVCEVKYDHMQGPRFRHAAIFQRWRPDKQATDCGYDQLEVTTPYELAKVFGAGV